jgi:hypothetical protein
LALFFVLVVGGAVGVTSCSRSEVAEIRYETLDGAGALIIDQGVGRRVLDELTAGNAPYESISNPIHDCGSKQFRCLSTAQSVFAVPNETTLSENLRYEAGGAVLRVLRCLHSAPGRACSTALIESECQKVTESGRCEPDPQAGPLSIAQATYFIYSDSRGVMAFGVVPIIRDGAALDEQVYYGIASQCVLKNRLGLLKAKIETAPPSE